MRGCEPTEDLDDSGIRCASSYPGEHIYSLQLTGTPISMNVGEPNERSRVRFIHDKYCMCATASHLQGYAITNNQILIRVVAKDNKGKLLIYKRDGRWGALQRYLDCNAQLNGTIKDMLEEVLYLPFTRIDGANLYMGKRVLFIVHSVCEQLLVYERYACSQV